MPYVAAIMPIKCLDSTPYYIICGFEDSRTLFPTVKLIKF